MRNRVLSFVALLSLLESVPVQAAGLLHPGDKVDVAVFNHPELSGSQLIDSAGDVSLPLVGMIPAAGSSAEELSRRLQSRFSAFVRNCSVQIRLEGQTQSIFVAGGPVGVLRYEPGETLASVADQLQGTAPPPIQQLSDVSAGVGNGVNGYSTTAGARQATHDSSSPSLDLSNGPIDFRNVRLQRERKEMGPYDLIALRSAGQSGPLLEPGDTVRLVDKPIAVSVSGEIQRPGVAHLLASEPLSAAIVQTGGPTPASSSDALLLVRGGVSRTVTAGSGEFTQPAQNGDRVYLQRAPRVDVVGDVLKPGDTLLRGNSTLLTAIYYAGGPSDYANLHAVGVIHNGVKTQFDLSKVTKGGSGSNPRLVNGDVVIVPDGSHFKMSDIWSAFGPLSILTRPGFLF